MFRRDIQHYIYINSQRRTSLWVCNDIVDYFISTIRVPIIYVYIVVYMYISAMCAAGVAWTCFKHNLHTHQHYIAERLEASRARLGIYNISSAANTHYIASPALARASLGPYISPAIAKEALNYTASRRTKVRDVDFPLAQEQRNRYLRRAISRLCQKVAFLRDLLSVMRVAEMSMNSIFKCGYT